jgi:hypothetical protein
LVHRIAAHRIGHSGGDGATSLGMRALMRQMRHIPGQACADCQGGNRQDGSIAGGGGHVTGGGVRCGAYLGGLIRDCARTLTDGFWLSHSRWLDGTSE